jgi:pyrroloquinoline quinone biosynthesis protein B
MIIKVLGSSAGGGFPQWNCNCRNCIAVRAGTPGFRARTQSSLAVSRDGVNWALLNASPDLRQQLNQTPELHANPKVSQRHSPIKAAVLTNGDVDHIIGLINLREAQPFSIYATRRVLQTIRANSVFQVLAEPLVPRIEIPLGKPFALNGGGVDLGLTVEAFAVPGKVALYLRTPPQATSDPGRRYHRPQDHRPGREEVVLLYPWLRRHRRHARRPPQGRIHRLFRWHAFYR